MLFIILFLILALMTGFVSFSGIIKAAALVFFARALFFFFVISLVGSVIMKLMH